MNRLLRSVAIALAITQFVILEKAKAMFPQAFKFPTPAHHQFVAITYTLTALILSAVMYALQWMIGF